MVRGYQCLFNSILFKEICEFVGNELGSVVRDNFFWLSVRRKPQSHLINSALSCCGSQGCHLHPLGMAVNQPKEVIVIFLCKINMHSLPHPSRLSPWVRWCTKGCVSHCLTNFTGSSGQLHFSIQIWPPDVTSGYCFHCNNTMMLFV